MKKAWLVASIVATFPSASNADVIEFGVVSRCDEKSSRFEVGAIVQHNEQITLVASSLLGINELKYGEHRLVCRIGGVVAKATITVRPPSNGHCMGGGYAEISQFSIGGQPVALFPESEPFNFSCLGTRTLIKLSTYTQDGHSFMVERCTSAEWTWENGYSKVECLHQQHVR
jgi:hypothetical protein